jgi:hypothetical protein
MKPTHYQEENKTDHGYTNRWFDGTAEYFMIMGFILVLLILFSLVGYYADALAR